jgi:plastocyanin
VRRSHPVMLWAALMVVYLAACSSSSAPSTLSIAKAPQSGDLQTGTAGQALPDSLRVLVTRDGQALAGTTVTWSTTASNATVNPTSVVTGSNGLASTSWTLGPAIGTQAASAAVQGASGSPVTFTAVSTVVGGGGGASVTVSNNVFTPADVTINAGETVTWTWGSGATSHSVQSTGSPSFPSSSILSGSVATYSNTFDTPGTYSYDCVVHGTAMSGTVTVQ